MRIVIEKTEARIGAVVHGVSLADIPVGETLEQLEDALEENGLLIFPDQLSVSPEQQITFSQQFGPLELVELEYALLPGHPEIFVVGNTGEKPVTFAPLESSGEQETNNELEWHTDHIHRAIPARASLLLGREVPARGGDTLFACMYTAYDALDSETRRLCDRLEVVNSVTGLSSYLQGQGHKGVHRTNEGEATDPPVIWPLVRAHPRTGRRALYFGNQVSVGVVGWSDDKARQFISDLTDHACQPAYQYRHKWRAGDAVLWDNWRVLHAGTPYDLSSERRKLYRTTIRETEPITLVG